MGRVEPPRIEGTVTLADGRRVGFAEYGPHDGRPVLWFHGTPGARRQVPLAARAEARDLGARIIAVERPGVGWSTPFLHESILDWTDDLAAVLDRLSIDRFSLVGLSGGGPYVLAAAYRFPTKVVSAAVMGGVAPTKGPDAAPGGLAGLAGRTAPLLHALHRPMATALWATTTALRPLADQAIDLYARLSPEGDRRVFQIPGMKDMFLDDLLRGSRRRFAAPVIDAVLFGRHWGFTPREIRVPVHFWQGDADPIVPEHHGRHLAELVPGASLQIRPGQGHLGDLAATDEVLAAVLGHWGVLPQNENAF